MASIEQAMAPGGDEASVRERGHGVTVAILLLLGAWVALVRWPSYDVASSDPDEAFFLLIGQRWLEGGLPYADLWDVKPPGLFAAFALAQWVFGEGILAARILTAFAAFATSAALLRFARRHLGSEAIGIAAALIYPLYTLILFGLRSRPEILFMPFVVLGLDLALTEARKDGRAAPRVVLGCGLLFGIAVTLKQTAVFEASLACAWLTLRWGQAGLPRLDLRAGLLFGAAGAAPLLAFTAYFASAGIEPALYLAPFIGAAHRLKGDGVTLWDGALRFLPMMKPILPLFAGGLLFLAERRALREQPHRQGRRALAFWALASMAGILAMRAMYDNYLTPLIAPLLLMTLLVARHYAARIVAGPARVAVALALLSAISIYPVAWLLRVEEQAAGWSRVPRLLVETMRHAGFGPNDRLYVAEDDTTTYLLAGTKPPTRYAFPQHLVCDFTLPDRDPAAEIERIMATRPRFVVLAQPHSRMACTREDRLAIVETALARDYTRLATVRDRGRASDLYCLAGTCLPGPGTN